MPLLKTGFFTTRIIPLLLAGLLWVSGLLAQPANDNCANASVVNIGSGGFGLGTFDGTQFDISAATLQTGETFAPGILTAGLSKKSMWYKFTLPTTRTAEVFLKQPSVLIADGNVGFAVYKASTCLPGDAQISPKLTPIAKFASSKHPCLEAGDYYVQVSANTTANGPVFISLVLGEPDPAPYDKPATASKFGKVNLNRVTAVEFDVSCQSIDNVAEVCLPNTSLKDYTKSTWHTFTTPDYFDYLAVMISGNTNNSWDQNFSKVGFRLFEGDITNTPLASLSQIGGCDSLRYNTFLADLRSYRCGMIKPNTTYTVQLLYSTSFSNTLRFAVAWGGEKPTRAPQPLTTILAENKIGVLPSSFGGVTTFPLKDKLACNARHGNYSCPKTLPATGLLVQGNSLPFNLSTFYSFTLANTAQLDIYCNADAGGIYLRLFKQSLVNNCSLLDTSNIISANYNNIVMECLPPGDYVIQIMGTDSMYYGANNQYPASSQLITSTNIFPFYRNLGGDVSLTITAKTQVGINNFSLSTPGAFEKINPDGTGVMQPIQLYKTYTTTPDTLGCSNTVLPDLDCGVGDQKASYREFVVADSGIFRLEANNFNWTSLFKGDANALATAQNAHSWPQKITGLTPVRRCMIWSTDAKGSSTCIAPGTYSLVSFGPLRGGYSNGIIIQQPAISVIAPKPKHITPQTAQDMGDLWAQLGPGGGVIASDIDSFTCYDNPAIIDGLEGCEWGPHKATKLIYRQFYLNQTTSIRIATGMSGYTYYNGYLTLFSGKATDGIGGLKSVGNSWKCFGDRTTAGSCTDLLSPGWYTVVSYGHGGSYQNPLQSDPANGYTNLGMPNAFYITLYPKTCASPQFNRPHKASIDTVTKKPYVVDWAPRASHTAAYPATWQTYKFNKENFDCTLDTGFIKQHMTDCNSNKAKVAFYVFQITKESYLKIGGIPDGIWSTVYAFDVRTTDSVRLKTEVPLQPCMDKQEAIEFCKLQPGYYTLIVLAPSTYTCHNIQPDIYVDQVGFSRFDHANNAYDFGTLKPDSVWYNGKTGDVNPLNGSRAPSNDFFYCTTGAQERDPNNANCQFFYNPEIYPNGNNKVLHPDYSKLPYYYYAYSDRRNLWYTFTVNQPGLVRVKVALPTPAKNGIGGLVVYKSDVDGSLPFSTVVSQGLVDSTFAQGLTLVTKNFSSNPCPPFLSQELAFYVDPCNFKPTRYYVILDASNSYFSGGLDVMKPNYQAEVSVLLGNIPFTPTKFDHYSQANDLGVVNSGKMKGAVDNFTCATKDPPDPIDGGYINPINCNKTLWYKFTTTVTGTIRYAAYFRNAYTYYYDHIQLFRQIKPGDSTSNGLLNLRHTSTYSNNGTWAQQCISPGTYYILLPGCNAVNDDVYPEIEIIPSAGDFCSVPMIANLSGAGSKVVPVTVDCHTIGTDYGEFNQTLTCPANVLTKDYKTSWYRLDIGGTDTLDLTVFINEKTNATSTDIKYRMMTGTCGAMQEQSCVQDALTRNTYECMIPGNSYYIQVFTPTMLNSYTPVTGDIDLNISAVKHVAPCAPANNCIAVAEFTPKFDCTKDRNISVTNLSTFGSDIKYEWDFGYNNQKSDAVSPEFFYPALTTDKTYTVTLKVTNMACGKTDEISKTITIPARPGVNLGKDTVICAGPASIPLDATSHTGTTYLWYQWIGYWNGFNTNPKINVTNLSSLIVELTYNNCKARDTVHVWINPITKKALQTQALCGVDETTLSVYRGNGEAYSWSTGATANSIKVTQPGYYWCDLYLNGCIVRDSFLVVSPSIGRSKRTITVCQKDMPYAADATISGASAYKWSDNNTNATRNLSSPGVWWVDVTINGCTIRDSILLVVDSFKTLNTTARICSGQTYRLPSGKMVGSPGLHRDTLRNIRGCDSLFTNLTLTVETAVKDSLATIFYAGQTYRLPWGKEVQAAGIYRDTLKSARGCDSLYRIVNLKLQNVQTTRSEVNICRGASYTLPWGKTVSSPGDYADTLRSSTDADSLIRIVTVSLLPKVLLMADTTVCQDITLTLRALPGLSYAWTPSAGLSSPVAQNPTWKATTSRTFTLQTNQIGANLVKNGDFEQGNTDFTTQYRYAANNTTEGEYFVGSNPVAWNGALNTCTNHTAANGKMLMVNGSPQLNQEAWKQTISVKPNTTYAFAAWLQALYPVNPARLSFSINGTDIGSQLTAGLPPCTWQQFYATWNSGNQTTATISIINKNTAVQGNDFALDDIFFGEMFTCADSVLVTVVPKAIQALTQVICIGDSVKLPSGRFVKSSGKYADTVRAVSGCDSLVTSLDLTVQGSTSNTLNAFICEGQTYRLPSGKIVNASGLYRDTLRYSTGCDSSITILNLTRYDVTATSQSITLCKGSSYTLPSGRVVSTTGTYRDTLRYPSGCDSLRFTLQLTVKASVTDSASITLCSGQVYTLPSGKTVNATGLYRDTLRGSTGCDSLVTHLNLTVRDVVVRTVSAFFCQGENYRLPSGKLVNTGGLHRDTLRYVSGCDSLITNATLLRYDADVQTLAATICLGKNYRLPSGRLVSTAGTHRDTLRYTSGCDSIRYILTLSVTDALRQNSTAHTCAGQGFRLPSGRMVFAAGLYRDTVRTLQLCDSLISEITLVVHSAAVQSLSPAICQGQNYRLPSGKMVNNSGLYRDTLRNVHGCDSAWFTINLSVTPRRFSAATVTLCSGQVFTRPSGKTTTVSGTYTDTIPSLQTGCDSIITTTLQYRPPLRVTLAAPASVCTGVTATLTATASGGNGGPFTFSWTGALGSGNTVTVSPSATTKYFVSVSDGCTVTPARDSVTISYVPPPQPGLNNATVSICLGSSTSLLATGGTTYAWSPATGLSSTTIANPNARPTTDTKYKVTVKTAEGCIGEDSILVKVTQPFTLTASRDTTICAGSSVQLSASGAQRYEWAGGQGTQTGSTITARPSVTTTFTVTGYGVDNCFTQTKSIRVTVIPLPGVDAGRDTTIRVGESITIKPTYTGANLQYRWTPSNYLSCTNCANPVATPEEPMEYTITVRNPAGCESTDRIRLQLLCNAESVFLPNTFTPNGDGVNDTWYPRGGGIRQVRYLKVFNRWGQLVFERTNISTDDRSAGWDGTYQGKPLPPDVFVFTLGATCDNGQTVETKGNVMIVR